MDREQVIVAEARRWLGTPYHHCADVRGPKGGVDCAMLLVRVFIDTGLVAPFDPRPYAFDWHMHRSEEKFLGWIERFAARIPDDADPRPGDVPLFRYGRCVSHGGIVESIHDDGDVVMIHAFSPAGCVSRAHVRAWPDRFAGYWRVV